MLGQLVGDREDARPQALVVAGEEAEDRREQRRCVERVGLVVLAQHAAGVDAVLEDVGLDLVGDAAPRRGEVAVGANLRELRRAVHRHPAHELRRDVVLRRAAGLPDALVGLAPDGGRAVGLGLHDRPQAARQALAALRVEQDRVERRAVDVVLALVERPVADADRPRPGVAREVVARRLGEVAAPVDPVHDLQPAVRVGLEVGDELHELVGLPVEVEVVQRLQGERRVAQPGVAVVPVALAARRLGQRGRQRRHGRAGGHVREALDRQRGPLDRRAPLVVGEARARQPRAPEARRRVHARHRVVEVGREREPLAPRERAVQRSRPRRACAVPGPGCPRSRAPCPCRGGSSARRRSRRRRGGRRRRATTRPARGRSRRRARRRARSRRLPRCTRPCGRAGARRPRRPAAACAA